MVTHAEHMGAGCVQFRFKIAWKDSIYIDSVIYCAT